MCASCVLFYVLRAGDDHKYHKSCVAQPLHMFPPDEDVIEIVPPPELHIMLGVVNWLYDILENHFDGAEKWYRQYHISKSPYHGNKFEGNGCHRLLQEDSLEYLFNMLQQGGMDANSLSFRVHTAMCAFRVLRHCCFSNILHQNYDDAIETFKISVSKLGRNRIPPKIHCITAHLSDWLQFTEQGLGTFSEQSLESIHYDFKLLWITCYQIRSLDNPNYLTKLLRCVVRFNARNIPTPHENISFDA